MRYVLVEFSQSLAKMCPGVASHSLHVVICSLGRAGLSMKPSSSGVQRGLMLSSGTLAMDAIRDHKREFRGGDMGEEKPIIYHTHPCRHLSTNLRLVKGMRCLALTTMLSMTLGSVSSPLTSLSEE
jgi:hypothetical protein